ncbi:MAG: hypothetical protein AB8H47_24050 [Bacteroidia bacterium]
MRLPLLPIRLIILLAFLSTACQQTEPIVRQAAEKYLEARLNDDFSRAMLYATADSHDRIEELASMTEENKANAIEPMQFRIMEVKLDGDSALVGYELENYFGLEYLRLSKVDQEWLVKLGLEDVPDPAMLAKDLSLMESEDTITKLERSLDKLLLEEEDSLTIEDSDLN